MAHLVHLLVLFAIALTVVAHPHVPRSVHHPHHGISRAVVPQLEFDFAPSIPSKKRSLSKRCIPRPSNATSLSSLPAPTSSVPINVAPSPVVSTTSSQADTSTSSVFVQPTTSQAPPPPPPTTSSTPPPPPTTSTPPPPSSTSAAPPAQTSSTSGNSGVPSFLIGTQTGQGTYYAPGLGACGITNTASQYIAAVSHLLFDAFPGYNGENPNDNPVCNQQVTASYQGKSVTVTITDRCTGCELTDLDFSPAAFTQLADESVGRIDIDWVWMTT